jgi:hypothetical protein
LSGSHVYSALETSDPAGNRDWLSTTSIGSAKAPNPKYLAQHLSIAPEFREHLLVAIKPGTTLIVSDLPVSRQTHSGSGFNILTAAR